MGRTNKGTKAELGGASLLSTAPSNVVRWGLGIEFFCCAHRGPGEWPQAETGEIQIKYFHCWCGQALERAAQGGGGVTIPGAAHEAVHLALGAVV